MHDAQEVQDYFRLWELEDHSPDWPLYKSAESTKLVRDRAASFGGLISISHFCRAFSELKASGSIKQIRNAIPMEHIEPDLTPEAYRKIPARETARRYMQDPDFKVQVDALIAKGQI